jgi:hypothetical protein
MSHDKDPTDLRGQEADAAERQRTALSEETLEVDDFKWLMGSMRGRRIVWRLLEKTGVNRTSMTGNSYTFFHEGQRNVGLMLMALINDHCGPEYVKMLQERTRK